MHEANTDRTRAIDASHEARGAQALSALKTLHDTTSSVGSTQATSIFDLFDQVLGAKTGTTTIQGVGAVAASQQTDSNAGNALLQAAYGGVSA